MKKPVLLVVHQKTSDPGRIGMRLRTLGHPIEICRHACGDPLPEDLSAYSGVVIFGGPQSANDDEFFIRNELDWTPRVVESGTPFLGVCLGAQILAKAAGGVVEGHPEGQVEIGYYNVSATQAGEGMFPDEMTIFQWHREGFSLPDCATLLVSGSEHYPVQGIGVGPNALGIQFHPEVTEQMNRRWLIGGAARLDCPGAQQPHEHMAARARHDPHVDQWVDGFLAGWLATDQRG